MSKLKESIKTVYFPIFSNYRVRIVVTEDVVRSRSKRDNYFGEPCDGEPAAGLHSRPKDGRGESWLFFRPDVSHSTVAHECFHCVYRLMRWLGAELENEVFAYHLGFLVEQVAQFLPRQKWKAR